MAYSPYNAVNAIYKLKGQWDSANKSGDETKKNEAAQKAQSYYNELRRNGYGSVADELTASDYAAAKSINDYYAKTGRTATRPYFYTLGKSKGLSESDIDKLIGWDNTTGEITFGGKNIGKPDSVVDGTSYWSDTSVLDKAFNDYVDKTGLTRSKETAVNQENEKLFAKYNQEYEDLKNTNPFETDTAKAILAKYDLAGLQGRDNQVASGAGSNGGNIDSFAAANALRQQSALVNKGQMVVLEEHQQKLDHARALLSDMGVNIDRVFNEGETEKNNQVSRDVATSEVTGVVPTSMLYQMPYYSQFFNTDGTLKNPDIDYKAEIEKAEAAGNTELAKVLRAARGVKIFSDYGKYGQYADGDYSVPGTKITESARQFNEQIAQADRALEAEKSEGAAERQNKLDQITTAAKYGTTTSGKTPTKTTGMTLAQATAALKGGELSQAAIDVYNANHRASYTTENPPPIYKPATTKGDTPGWADGGSGDTPETDYEAKLNTVYNDSSKTVKDYIRNKLKPLITENSVTEEELRNHLINNSKDYDLEVKDIKAICEALDVDSMWVDNYKNSGLFGWGSGVKEK